MKEKSGENRENGFKIYFSDSEMELVKRRFPRGAVQIIARSAILGLDLPAISSVEEEKLHSIKLLLAYVGQQLDEIVTALDDPFPDDITSQIEIHAEQFVEIIRLLRSIAEILGFENTAASPADDSNSP
jgi:hypothetical protein